MKKLIYIFAIATLATSCNSTTTPGNAGHAKEDANKARVQAFYDQMLNAHNTAMIDSFCTAEFVDHNPDQGKTGQGTAELKTSFGEWFAACPDIHIATNFMIAEGDTVMSHVTMTGTNSGPMMGMPATNKQFSIQGIDIVALKDGKATDRWGIFQDMKMMQQLGVIPAPGAMPDSSKMSAGKK